MISSATARYDLMWWARAVFLVLAVGFGGWTIVQSWEEVVVALSDISAVALSVSVVFTVAGTLLTGVIWIRFFSVVGSPISFATGSRLFFTGQLGKYMPGGIWNFVAHAVSGRTLGLPPRVAVGAGLFLLYMLAVTGGVIIVLGAPELPHGGYFSPVLLVITLAVAIVLLLPASLNRAANLIFRQETPSSFSLPRIAEFFLWATLVWVSYGVGIAALGPDRETFMSSLLGYSVAFVFAFFAGLVVPIAPAGLGVRETALVFALSDEVGIGTALAIAILSRLVHTVVDFMIVAVLMSVMRFTNGGQPANWYSF